MMINDFLELKSNDFAELLGPWQVKQMPPLYSSHDLPE